MEIKMIAIVLGIIFSESVQASPNKSSSSQAVIINQYFAPHYYEKTSKVVDEDAFDDEEFYDAESHDDILQVKDIEAQDEYSGFDKKFDDLYKFAKRDLYLAQENERLFPDEIHVYEGLKTYYKELKKQREEMAYIKKAMGSKLSKAYDEGRLDFTTFEPEVQLYLAELQKKAQKIFHVYVQQPLFNKKVLVHYKVPYEPQLKINDLEILRAKTVLDQLQK